MATNGKKISELTEVLSVDTNNDYVVISRNGDNKKLKVANMMGSTNVGDNYIDLTSYEDFNEISDYAKEATAWAVKAGYINGRSETRFEPDYSITREEVVKI